jgi:hypothetical protein
MTIDNRRRRQNTIGNPVKAAELSRLKKQWRKEWEEERKRDESEESCLEALDAQIDRMRGNWLAGMTSRTRALYEAFEAAEAEDKAAGRTAWDEAEEEAGNEGE